MHTGFWWNGVIDVKQDEDTEPVMVRINFENITRYTVILVLHLMF